MRIAIIGSGIAGLAAAHELSRHHAVTLYEADSRAGGHAHTVDVTLDGIEHPVDTGFLVLNEKTYPKLLTLFDELRVPLAASDMSFSVSVRPDGVEWCGANLRSVFAQPRNLASPRFLRMLADVIRFNRTATALAQDGSATALEEPLGDWLARTGFGTGFRDWYLLPMAAAIWSCPMSTMLRFPVGSFVRFFHNHGLLQVNDRPQWFTVRGGSRRYVDAILEGVQTVRLGTPVRRIDRSSHARSGLVTVRCDDHAEGFEAVVLATHSPDTLALLDEPTPLEAATLGAIRYQDNEAWLHTDASLMPERRSAWAAWNYLAAADEHGRGQSVSVTYWLNRLQPLPFSTPVFVSLNPLRAPRPESVIRRMSYAHPVFDQAAVAAQADVARMQGTLGTWTCGAWQGYGFHEDGLASAQRAVGHLMSSARPLANAA